MTEDVIPTQDVTQIAADEPEERGIEATGRAGIDDERPSDPDDELASRPEDDLEVGLEVDEFDAMEQARVVPDEDDYDR